MKPMTARIVPILAGAALLGGAGTAGAQTTRIMIRVVAHDAKIVGSGVGGAHVTVRDAETGRVLAEGTQEGSTGNTDLIMGTRERGGTVYATEGAAGFLAELDIDHPTRIRIEARGPLGTPHAVQEGSTTLLALPGVDLLGEGVVLELYGFTVEIQAPTTEPVAPGEPFAVRARVTMLCGCPTQPGGLWDSNDYTILARLVSPDGQTVGEWPLAYSGTTSEYEATARVDSAGEYELRVIAFDAAKANAGMATRALRVR